MSVVTFNIGGSIFQTEITTLTSAPGTRLSDQKLLSWNFHKDKQLFFFDRDPVVFGYILNFCRTGELHLPSGYCSCSIKRELEFWMIPEDWVSDCCWKNLHQMKSEKVVVDQLNKLFYHEVMDHVIRSTDMTPVGRIRHTLWMFMEYPNSSIAAKIWECLMYILIVISTLLFLMESLADLRHSDPDMLDKCNITAADNMSLSTDLSRIERVLLTTRPLLLLERLDWSLSLVFLADIAIRFILCPRKRGFFTNVINVTDVVYLAAKFPTTYIEMRVCLSSTQILWMYIVLKMLTAVRLIRLFRIGRSCGGLKILFLVIKVSVSELALMIISLACVAVLFAAAIYMVELREETFKNMFHACWWAAITMTTVGYGDVVPVTPVGCVVGALCSVVGLLLLTLPIAIIGTKFATYYAANENRSLFIREKRQLKTIINENQVEPKKTEIFKS